MGHYVLGIDLGTTNSVVAVADGNQVRVLSDEAGARLIPSVVSFLEDGAVIVGEAARERRLVDAPHTVYSVKRLIGRQFSAAEVSRAQQRFAFDLAKASNGGVVVAVGGQTYSLTEISAFVLREVKRVAEEVLGEPCEKAVITVPANFNELQRSATKAAGRVAGLDVIRILNEPTAAALAYGYSSDRPERVAIFDLGGGTFDLTVLELEDDVFEVVATAGDSFLGGDDVDLAVAEAMADAFLEQHGWDPRRDKQAFERLRAAAEWAKCQLSVSESATLTLEELVYDAHGAPLDLVFEMTREELETRARPILARSFDVCNQAMKEAGFSPREVGATILVGGSTRMPLVRSMVEEYFGKPPRIDIDPDLVVAQGAAIHGYAVNGGGRTSASSPGPLVVRPMSVADLRAAQKKRGDARQAGPKQPAFAPTSQYEVPPTPATIPLAPRKQRSLPPGALVGMTSPHPPGVPAVVPFAPPLLVGDEAELELELLDEVEEVDDHLPDILETSSLPQLHAAPPPPARLPSASAPHGRGSHPRQSEPRSSVEISPDYLEEARASERAMSEPPSARDLFGDMPLDFVADVGPPQRSGHEGPRRSIPETRPMMPVLQMPERPPPLLMDVTPHALGIETVSGICQHLIRRNVPIPCEQTRTFTTARDDQSVVSLRIFQGESRVASENQELGQIELTELRPAPRGQVHIEVTFLIDPSGTLDVRAVDKATGKVQQTRINLLGGADEAEHAAMSERHRAALLA